MAKSARGKGIGSVIALGMLCLMALVGASPAQAQDPPSITAKLLHSQSAYAVGGSYPLAIELTIAPGLHINSDRPSEPDLFPSSLKATAAPGLALSAFGWPPAKPYKPAWAAKSMLVLEGKVILRATLTVAKDVKPGQHQLSAKLSFQACDDQSCLMPEDLDIPMALAVIPAGGKSEALNPGVFKK